jgi:hypothetical protein
MTTNLVVTYTETTPSVIRSWNISFIMVWKVVGLFVRLKYMTRGSNKPLFVDERERILILLGDCIQSSVVLDEAELSIFLLDKEDRHSKR